MNQAQVEANHPFIWSQIYRPFETRDRLCRGQARRRQGSSSHVAMDLDSVNEYPARTIDATIHWWIHRWTTFYSVLPPTTPSSGGATSMEHEREGGGGMCAYSVWFTLWCTAWEL